MWSFDEDDNLLYVFHARTSNRGLTGRDTFVRRVHFTADGIPVLDMEADEEVAPENRTVSVTVTVESAPLDVTATVGVRCVGTRVVQTITLTNGEAVPVSVRVSSPYGGRTTPVLLPGRTVSYAFTTRGIQIGGGSVTVEAEATRDGQAVSSTTAVPFDAASCR